MSTFQLSDGLPLLSTENLLYTKLYDTRCEQCELLYKQEYGNEGEEEGYIGEGHLLQQKSYQISRNRKDTLF